MRVAIACLMLSTTFPGSATAARWSALVGGGVGFPASSSNFQEGLGAGLHATAGVVCELTPFLSLVGRGSYSDYARDDEGTVLVAGIDKHPHRILEMSGGTMTIWEGSADLRFYPTQAGSSVRPYVMGGAGVATHCYEGVEIAYAYAGHTWPATIPADEGTEASLAAGAGVSFATGSRVGLGLEARLQVLWGQDSALWSVPLWLEVSLGL